jgi:hypothetical protein
MGSCLHVVLSVTAASLLEVELVRQVLEVGAVLELGIDTVPG